MRRIVFLIVSFLVWSSCFAQEDTAPMWGIKASFDINMPGKWHTSGGGVRMYRHGYGFAAGPVCNLYLGKGFFLEPGVSIYYDSYSYYNISVTNANGQIVDSDPKQYKVGVRVPVVAGYAFNITDRFSMSIFTGPEFNYSFAGKIKARHPEMVDGFPLSPFEGHRRFDCAWKVGIGFPFENFMLSLDGAIGMVNLMKNKDVSFRENRLTMAITYYF